MMQTQSLRPYFLILLLLGALLLTAAVFWPFLKPLALAAVFAVVLQGIHRGILGYLGGKWPSIAALLTVLLAVVLILLPLTVIGVLVGNEARDMYVSLEQGSGQQTLATVFTAIDDSVSSVVPALQGFTDGLSTNIDSYVKEALQWITGHSGQIFSQLSRLALAFFVFFAALYYLLRDGGRVQQALIDLSPLADREDRRVFERLERAINSTIRGSLVIALLQGVLSTVGFLIFGVPNAILWGTVAAVAALIPGVGTSLVLIPAVIFLFAIGATPQAIGLLIWSVLAVGLIDNVLGPKLMGRGMHIHPLLVLLSVFGGIIYFGPAGIFLGPLTLSLLFALLSIYAEVSRA